jgi:hypothetical protein
LLEASSWSPAWATSQKQQQQKPTFKKKKAANIFIWHNHKIVEQGTA